MLKIIQYLNMTYAVKCSRFSLCLYLVKIMNVQQPLIDTRRKILIGACMMKLAEENPEANDRMLRQLDRFLTEERDRKLLNLSNN
ncbi:Hypothetical protein F387_01956 [Wohlfahrtiimonas chitiniclastica SH04]|uniref:Uncharacterized protein n=1 Tax=Wohlfahrtiimonas chitiniclastica SH04 TaxID=1261130 RepID=L8XT72_9GAMM|nr:hypothetical protein [Wohlfahrtiimonas chitiniclastica]ELV07233.1 Hypothetical protein F387_01956 [Wohlfahrtiimonas chitiniclastica SH04]